MGCQSLTGASVTGLRECLFLVCGETACRLLDANIFTSSSIVGLGRSCGKSVLFGIHHTQAHNARMSTRRPTHAGSWYTADAGALTSELSGWLREAGQPSETTGTTRAIIAPHAGYSYSGPTAAWAYKHMHIEGVKRVFLLGPSHNLYSPKCLLSGCTNYATPIGSVEIDQAVYDELASSNLFDEMQLSVDEREHSLEMHLPYIMHVMGTQPYTLVPIMVGALNEAAEARYGKLLAPYLADPENLFVISSDFCHWGERFNYTPYDQRQGEIFQYIEALDRQGMALIEAQNAPGFAAYQREVRAQCNPREASTCPCALVQFPHATRRLYLDSTSLPAPITALCCSQFSNTICGRHPIAVLLHSLAACAEAQHKHKLTFVRYAQSSPCRSMDDSSVSYASAVITTA